MAEQGGILIVGPNWVGDMVMAQCLVKAIRQLDPDAPIDVMAPEKTAPLASRMAEVRKTIVTPFRHGRLDLKARFHVARQLKRQYRQAYILPNSLKSALVPWLARIPRRTGYVGEQRYGLLNDARRSPAGLKRRTAARYQSLADIGPLKQPRLEVDTANQKRLCDQWGLAAGKFLLMAPGADYGTTKRWPADRFGELARRYARDGVAIAVAGGVGDVAFGRAIAAAAPGTVDLCGQTNLDEVIDLTGAARGLVTNDSGLMHIGAAVGTPLVAIYGSTVPVHTPPLSERARTVSAGLACSPCFERICPLGHMNCLNTLSVDRIEEETDRLFDRAER